MKVKDVMTEATVKSCSPETKIATATKLMKESNRGALPVVDKNQKVVGIITDRDICLSLASHQGQTPAQITVKDILPHAKVHTIKTEDSVTDALREMRKNKIGRLPVTNKEGKLKGMISINTLLSNAINSKDEIGRVEAKEETLAKTIKALFDRNNAKADKKKLETPLLQIQD
jgi:CBS domain-containing protein